MKKLICFLLLAALLIAVMASCGNPADPSNESAGDNSAPAESSQPEESQPAGNLVKKDFGGQTITVFTQNYSVDQYSEIMDNKDVAGFNSTLNTAINARREAVEQDYGVTFTEYVITEASRKAGEYLNACREMVTSGTNEYDILYPSLYNAATLASEGVLVNFREAEGIDIANPWWSQTFIADTNLFGNYYLVGDINTNAKRATSCVLFNKTILDQHQKEYPYELVREKKWTLDAMFQYVKDLRLANDDDGDGVITDKDTFGISGQAGNVIKYLHGVGGHSAMLGADGLPHLSFYSEYNVKCLQKVIEMMNDNDEYLMANQYSGESLQEAFRSNRCLYIVGGISDIMVMGEMEGDFGIVPFPLGEEDTGDYHALLGTYVVNAYCVMNTLPEDQIYRSCVLLDALGAYAVDTIAKTYVNTVLEYQKLRSDDDVEMLGIIFNGFSTDLGCIYSLGNIESEIASLYRKTPEMILSTYDGFEGRVNAAIDQLVQDFEMSLKK